MTSLIPIDRVVPRHLDDDVLVAYLDGELPDDERSGAASHFEQCWECRSRLAAVEASIDSFLRARRALITDDVPPSAPALAQFRRRLEVHAESLGHGTFLHRQVTRIFHRLWPISILTHAPLRGRAFGFAIAIVVIATALMWWAPPLSAKDVLAQAEVREFFSVRMAEAVVTSKAVIERVDRHSGNVQTIGTLETMKDYASFAVSAVAESSPTDRQQEGFRYEEDLGARRWFLLQLGPVFGAYAQSLHWIPTVSVAGYQQLIRDRGQDVSFASRVGTNSIELRHPFSSGHRSGLNETRLLLDAATYVPTQISVFVTENGTSFEYRFRRLSLQFVTRSPELADRFASVRVDAAGDLPKPLPPLFDPTPVRRPLPRSYADSLATTDEVAATVALHRIGADLGEEVNVFPMSDGSLLVQGLVDTDARKSAIDQALAHVSGRLRAQVFIAGRLTTSAELYDSPYGSFGMPLSINQSGSPAVRVVDFTGNKMALYDLLHDHFAVQRGSAGAGQADAIQRDMTAFVSDAMAQSEAALFHAWALRKLDVEFSPLRASQLSPAALAEVSRIREEHRRAVTDASHRLSTRLAIVLPAAGDSPKRSADPSELDGAALVRLTSQQRDLVRDLLTPSAKAPDVAPTVARLVTLLKRLG